MALTHSSLSFASTSRRPLLAIAIALVLSALQPSVLRAQDKRGFAQAAVVDAVAVSDNYYALVIGIDKYPAPLHQLKTAVNDAQSVGSLLRDRYGFQVQYLLDQNATRYNILNALGKLRTALHEDDSLLIYYGGHGYFDHDTDRAYWLPVDADSGTSPNTIMADDLTSLIRALPSRHVLIVSDSCYSGGLSRDTDEPTRTGSDPGLLNRELRSRSRTLMASGGNEPVSDSGANGHSVFANAILNALDRTDEPMFTAIDLFYASIRRQVAGKSAQLPEYSTIRNSNDEDGDFVFVRKDSPKAPGPAPPRRATEQETIAATPVPIALSPTPAENYSRGMEFFKVGEFAEALPPLTQACDGGNAEACNNLGFMYANGRGVGSDEAQAVSIYHKGCNGGSSDSCSSLGYMYEHGNGVGKDYAHAVSFSRKACDAGDARGCGYLGEMFEFGKGVDLDKNMAIELYRKACYGGNVDGCKNLKRLAP